MCVGGDGIVGSIHGLFTFLMVHCLGYSIQKDMNEHIEINATMWTHNILAFIDSRQLMFNKSSQFRFFKKRFASNMKTKHLTQPL